eukprot:4077655-Prymnesium_polylepis.1
MASVPCGKGALHRSGVRHSLDAGTIAAQRISFPRADPHSARAGVRRKSTCAPREPDDGAFLQSARASIRDLVVGRRVIVGLRVGV